MSQWLLLVPAVFDFAQLKFVAMGKIKYANNFRINKVRNHQR